MTHGWNAPRWLRGGGLLALALLLAVGHAAARDYLVPMPGYDWAFPRDHANHSDYAVEWWYYTGHLLPEGADQDDPDAWVHAQVTFFRTGLPGKQSGSLHFGHLALAAPGRDFAFSEKIARGLLGEAGARDDHYRVWIDTWRAEELAGRHLLEAWDPRTGGVRLLAEPVSDPVLHGRRGYSVKGPGGDEASYYYSIPELEAEGWYLPPETRDGSRPGPVKVCGTLWMDHEFGNQQMGEGLIGWDWWGLSLPGGDHLMLYLIRRVDGTPIPQSGGTYITSSGATTRIRLRDVTVEPKDTWTSPHSGVTYPHGWTIKVPMLDLTLDVEPIRDDAELRTDRSTRVTYYEGPVMVTRNGSEGTAMGYVELVGYADTE